MLTSIRIITSGLTAAVLMSMLALTNPAFADDNHGKDIVKKCGIVTCSTYYSHEASVQIDEALEKGDPTKPADAAAFACTLVLTAAPSEPLAAGCLALGAVALANEHVKDIIHHAATSNGCVRFRTARGIDDVVSASAVYADHSETCHSMD